VGRIALASYQNENWDIYVISADGSYGSLNRLTTEPDDDGEPAWSPDGRRIAYASLVGANPGIYVLEADGRSPRQLVYTTPSFGAGRPSWSPDGRQLVFSCRPPEAGNWEICIVDADGRNPRNITNSPAGDGSPAWSPDGWRIAFTSTVDDGFDLFVINSDGSGLTRLTKDAWARLPAWSPDGQQIAFLKNHHQLHTIRPDGSDLRQVGPYMMSAFAWSPDGQYFAFSSSSETDLIVITADGRAVTTLSTTCACRQLSWTAP
jgi:Tol biopolymer transport system component